MQQDAFRRTRPAGHREPTSRRKLPARRRCTSDTPVQRSQRPRFYVPLAPPTVTHVLMGLNVAMFVAMVAYGYFEYGTFNGTEDIRVLESTSGPRSTTGIGRRESGGSLRPRSCTSALPPAVQPLCAVRAGPDARRLFRPLALSRHLSCWAGCLAAWRAMPFRRRFPPGHRARSLGWPAPLTVYFFFFRENFGAQGRAMLQNMLVVIVINLVFGLTVPGIDNWGHIGGLVGGALVAHGLLPRYRAPWWSWQASSPGGTGAPRGARAVGFAADRAVGGSPVGCQFGDAVGQLRRRVSRSWVSTCCRSLPIRPAGLTQLTDNRVRSY